MYSDFLKSPVHISDSEISDEVSGGGWGKLNLYFGDGGGE